jgi:hypothetical protein
MSERSGRRRCSAGVYAALRRTKNIQLGPSPPRKTKVTFGLIAESMGQIESPQR